MNQLVCPKCKAALRLEVDVLNCNKHGDFPILDGIPSFEKEHEFDGHWSNNNLSELPEEKLHVAKAFLNPIIKEGLSAKNILDAGSGDGVHLKVLEEINKTTKKVYGIDISISALNLSRQHFEVSPNLVHGSIDELPFADSFFDTVFSFGVIAYTNNPKNTFRELVRVLKPNGQMGVWIYPKQEGIGGIAFSWVRKFCHLTGKTGTNLLANLIVPFLAWLPTRSKVSLSNSSWKACKEVVLVNIAPSQLFFPTQQEVEAWFSEFDLEIISSDMKNPITIWAKKN